MSEQTTPTCCDVVCNGRATPGCAMQTTPRTVAEAAQEWLVGYHGSIDATALLLAFRAGARWQAARMPSVEEVAVNLSAHARLRQRDLDDPWLVCSGCGVEIETDARAAREEFAAHQAERVVALWGVR